MKQPFPFSAIVGQDEMKRAMLLTAIDPSIGGVLVFGDRGTGKSTAVRALAALLPPIKALKDCPVNAATLADSPAWAGVTRNATHKIPTPVVDLPLGASEARVTGALDIEKALTKGEKAFQPGLLAQANRGYLYIDEVNLLEDHQGSHNQGDGNHKLKDHQNFSGNGSPLSNFQSSLQGLKGLERRKIKGGVTPC